MDDSQKFFVHTVKKECGEFRHKSEVWDPACINYAVLMFYKIDDLLFFFEISTQYDWSIIRYPNFSFVSKIVIYKLSIMLNLHISGLSFLVWV